MKRAREQVLMIAICVCGGTSGCTLTDEDGGRVDESAAGGSPDDPGDGTDVRLPDLSRAPRERAGSRTQAPTPDASAALDERDAGTEDGGVVDASAAAACELAARAMCACFEWSGGPACTAGMAANVYEGCLRNGTVPGCFRRFVDGDGIDCIAALAACL